MHRRRSTSLPVVARAAAAEQDPAAAPRARLEERRGPPARRRVVGARGRHAELCPPRRSGVDDVEKPREAVVAAPTMSASVGLHCARPDDGWPWARGGRGGEGEASPGTGPFRSSFVESAERDAASVLPSVERANADFGIWFTCTRARRRGAGAPTCMWTDRRPVLIWFRHHLPARRTTRRPRTPRCSHGRPALLPVFVLDDAAAGPGRPAAASRWWLRQPGRAGARPRRARRAAAAGARPRGDRHPRAWPRAIGATEVLAGRALSSPGRGSATAASPRRWRPPAARLRLATSSVLREPARVMSGSGKPYAVYTPFAKAVAAMGEPDCPLPAPTRLRPVATPPPGDRWTASASTPSPASPTGPPAFPALWTPGEAGAQARLARFVAGPVAGYASAAQRRRGPRAPPASRRICTGARSRRARSGTRCAQASRAAVAQARDLPEGDPLAGIRLPPALAPAGHCRTRTLRAASTPSPGSRTPRCCAPGSAAGPAIPIVDAGMRQLWRTGWMHNRVRMIAASLPREAPAAALAGGRGLVLGHAGRCRPRHQQRRPGNGWRAAAADAAPYFRVFNPVLQGEKFDAGGDYVRRWVPELAALPDEWLHRPWEAPAEVLRGAGIALGRDYPRPVIDHAEGRARALAAFAALGAPATRGAGGVTDAATADLRRARLRRAARGRRRAWRCGAPLLMPSRAPRPSSCSCCSSAT